MRMKTETKLSRTVFPLILALVAVSVAGLVLSGCKRGGDQAAAREKTLYTCGMHPQVIQNHAGNCPICGMKLIPIRKKPGAGAVVTNFATGATGAGRRVKYYKSSMNAGEVSQNPGKDTMGMEMVAVYEDESAADSGSIVIDPATVQNMDIRTAVVARGPLPLPAFKARRE